MDALCRQDIPDGICVLNALFTIPMCLSYSHHLDCTERSGVPCKIATGFMWNLLVQARMSQFNDSSSTWERAKQEHDTSIDKVMKRDWMDNPARQGNRLSPRPVMSAQVTLLSDNTSGF